MNATEMTTIDEAYRSAAEFLVALDDLGAHDEEKRRAFESLCEMLLGMELTERGAAGF